MSTDLQPVEDNLDDVGQTSLADKAHAAVLRQIWSGRLAPGDALSVPALARELNLGRSPVREAVQRLMYEGMATHTPKRGAQVIRLNVTELSQIYAVKQPLEAMAAGLATPNFTDAGIVAIQQMVDRQWEALGSSGNEVLLIELDVAFHKYIRDVAANPFLSATVEQFTSRTNMASPSGWSDPNNARHSLAEHQAIVDAIAAGDAEGAYQATDRHLRCLRNRLTRWHQSSARGPHNR